MRASLLTGAALLLGGVTASTLDPIVIKGNKFFFSGNGSQFYIKGVAYQQDVGAAGAVSSTAQFLDPLSSSSNCKRDVPLLQQLGTNLIRVYSIDPTLDHSECMSLLDAAGIYVLADLGSPNEGDSINRASPQWNTALYQRYTSVVDAMQNYTNVMGFFAGNEVTNNLTNTQASAFVKAAVRDTKAYIKAKNYHPMGVGYASDDDQFTRFQTADYMNCGDPADAIDFWGYNIYEWCGLSSFTKSGYDQRTAEFANYTVPAFFAEYGCDTGVGSGPDAATRPWTEVGALFGPDMDQVFSGGIAYEYFQEVNDFGLVTVDSSNSVSTLADFNALKTQIASVSPTVFNSASFTPTNTAVRDCPTIAANFWQAASSPLPPSPNADLCDCMVASLSCTTVSKISNLTVGEQLNVVCSPTFSPDNICAGINANATTGKYGAYSMCTGEQQLAFVYNAYYNTQTGSNKALACDFGGNATTQTPSKATGSCATLLSQAGVNGTGSVSSSPTAGGGSGSAASGSASSSHSKGAASSNFIPGLGNGWSNFISFAVYISGAAAVGMGMVWM